VRNLLLLNFRNHPELGHVGVEVHPVDAFQFHDDVFALELGDGGGQFHGGSGWVFVLLLQESPPLDG